MIETHSPIDWWVCFTVSAHLFLFSGIERIEPFPDFLKPFKAGSGLIHFLFSDYRYQCIYQTKRCNEGIKECRQFTRSNECYIGMRNQQRKKIIRYDDSGSPLHFREMHHVDSACRIALKPDTDDHILHNQAV